MMERQFIAARLEELARKDAKRTVFGSEMHDYKLNPPLDPEVIGTFESQHGISLPDDYRQFITEIGNGGAGPAYGLFPFGKQDDSFGLRSWEGGYLVGDIEKAFPHKEAWNLDESFWRDEPAPEGVSEEEGDRLWEEWDELLEATYWNPEVMNGAIPICHLGCAQRQWLVVNGDQHGFVWDDRRAGNGGLAPAMGSDGKRLTFADWYLAWLKNAEQGLTDRWRKRTK